MLGVTSFITNNIASVPFLWIAPLSLYLLTFVIVFAKRPWVSSKMLGALLPFIIAIAILFTALGSVITVPAVIVALISYFILALYCHARLAEARPTASELTSFYIFMSLGGVLGGVANALVAPLIFDRIIEYILVMWLISLLLLPGMSWLKKLL